MKKVRCSFYGRKNDAIGVCGMHATILEVEDQHTDYDIELKLYDTYEHISSLKIEVLENEND